MMSSGGAAVGFSGANADSTGVTARASSVGDGSCLGAEVDAGVEEQAFKIRINGRRAKGSLFIRAPQ
jgi:hypothetical protein